MANPKGTPQNLKKFQPGQSGNPLGGRLHNPELRAIKRLTAHEVAEIGSLIVSKNLSKLRAIVKDARDNPDSKHSGLKSWIAMVAIKGISKGDAHALDVLLNRLIGKVSDKVQVTGEDGGPIRSLVGAMTREDRLAELKRLRKMRQEAGED